MAAQGEDRRQRLNTDLVLQLLLDEKLESESDSESISEYIPFIGKVLTDSEGEQDSAEGTDNSFVYNTGISGDGEQKKTHIETPYISHHGSEENSDVLSEDEDIRSTTEEPCTGLTSQAGQVPTILGEADQRLFDPFASSDSQTSNEAQFTILEQPSSSNQVSSIEEDCDRDIECLPNDEECLLNGEECLSDDECLSSESMGPPSEDDEHCAQASTRRGRRGCSRVIRRTVGRTRTRNVRGGRTCRPSGLSMSFIPNGAHRIEDDDTAFQEPMEFQPSRQPGPQISLCEKSPLDVFQLFCDDELLAHLVASTNAYTELKKAEKPVAYKRFMLSRLSKEEMLKYIGVLLLLSVNAVRSYRLAWNPKSSQVRAFLLCTKSMHANVLMYD